MPVIHHGGQKLVEATETPSKKHLASELIALVYNEFKTHRLDSLIHLQNIHHQVPTLNSWVNSIR